MNGGGEQVVAVDSKGAVWDWGCNASGQLGNGTFTSSWRPQNVGVPTTVKQVAAGQKYSLALSSDGKHVYAWGDNTKGELGIGTSAISMSDVPLQVDIPLPKGRTISAIADGGNGAFALLSNGHVMAWGANDHDQAGQDSAIPGKLDIYTPAVIPRLSHIVALAAGDHQVLALKADGTVWAWGGNRYGQLGPNGPTPSTGAATDKPVQVIGLPKIAAIATGGESSLALDTQGHVWSWGRNGFGELGWGGIDPQDGPHPGPSEVVGLSDIVSIDGEGPTSVAADGSGNVYAWGFNRHGEVGNGAAVNTGMPQHVLTLPVSTDPRGPSVQVTAGHWFNYAFNGVTGQTLAWGRNRYGELGLPPDYANDDPSSLGDLFGSHVHDANSMADQVEALYQAILGHAPDPLALEQWIDAGTPIKTIARDLLSSSDYTNAHGSYKTLSDDAFVAALQEASSHNVPSNAGDVDWIKALRQGASRPTIAVEIALSRGSLADIAGPSQAGIASSDVMAGSIAPVPGASGIASHAIQAPVGTALAGANAMIGSSDVSTAYVTPTNAEFTKALFDGASDATGVAYDVVNQGDFFALAKDQTGGSPTVAMHLATGENPA